MLMDINMLELCDKFWGFLDDEAHSLEVIAVDRLVAIKL
jgi:hypothetical protein